MEEEEEHLLSDTRNLANLLAVHALGMIIDHMPDRSELPTFFPGKCQIIQTSRKKNTC